MDVFAYNLRRLRMKKRLTTRDLAAAAPCSRGYISQLESGRHSPTLDIAMHLAEALGCELNDFLKPIEREDQ